MKHALLAALTVLLCLLTACGSSGKEAVVHAAYGTPEIPEAASPDLPEEPEEPGLPEPEPPDPIQVLLEGMTLEEKVGQLFFVRCPETGAVEDVAVYHLGGYILFGRDTRDQTAGSLRQTIDAYQAEAGKIPLLIGVDEEGGTVVRVSANPQLRAEKFPNPRTLWQQGAGAVTADTREKSRLLKDLGINVNLAPVADVSTDPNDFIYKRTTGEDAETAASYVTAVVTTMGEEGMGSVLKHFPGYGNNVDTHTGVALDQRPRETFDTADFLPFQAGLAAGGEKTAVLVSHNIVVCMDPELPASLSPAVHKVLREGLGFDGVVMTDDLAMDAVEAYAEDGAVAVMALQAGNDLIITTDYRTQIPKAVEAVRAGELPEPEVDAACERVLRWKQALGLLPEEIGEVGA